MKNILKIFLGVSLLAVIVIFLIQYLPVSSEISSTQEDSENVEDKPTTIAARKSVENENQEVSPTDTATENVPLTGENNLHLTELELEQSRIVNGVNITLNTIRVDGGYFAAEICFDLPTEADWIPGMSPSDVFLTIEDETIFLSNGHMIGNFQFADDGTRIGRCESLAFPYAKLELPKEFSLTIKRLATSVPEQPDCEKAQEKLNPTGIVIECHNADHSFGYDIVQKPDDINDSDANDLVWEALHDTFEGPWVFEVSTLQ